MGSGKALSDASKFLETEYSLFWLELLSLSGNLDLATHDLIDYDEDKPRGMLDVLDTHSNLPVCALVSSSMHALIIFLDLQPIHSTCGRDARFCSQLRRSHFREHTASLLLPHVDPVRFAPLGCLGKTFCSNSSAEGSHTSPIRVAFIVLVSPEGGYVRIITRWEAHRWWIEGWVYSRMGPCIWHASTLPTI